jgi:hypothetical protein
MIVMFRCGACGFIQRIEGSAADRVWQEHQAATPHLQTKNAAGAWQNWTFTPEALAAIRHPLNGRGRLGLPDAKCDNATGLFWRLPEVTA